MILRGEDHNINAFKGEPQGKVFQASRLERLGTNISPPKPGSWAHVFPCFIREIWTHSLECNPLVYHCTGLIVPSNNTVQRGETTGLDQKKQKPPPEALGETRSQALPPPKKKREQHPGFCVSISWYHGAKQGDHQM